MNKLNARLVLATVASTVLLAGCGGGGGSDSAADSVTPSSPQTLTAVVNYINNLITGTSENGDPVDVNALTLAEADADEPVAID